jgi:hypothetical protein
MLLGISQKLAHYKTLVLYMVLTEQSVDMKLFQKVLVAKDPKCCIITAKGSH